jgi:hypothetical protein
MVTTMTWLIGKEYLVSNDHSYVPFVVCCNKDNTMAATCGAETAYPYRVPEFSLVWILVLVGFVLFMLSHYMSSRF